MPPKEKSYFSQLTKGDQSFGEKAARRLELDYKMGDRYLDTPSPIAGNSPLGNVEAEVDHREADRRIKKTSSVSAHDADDDLPDEFVYVPESKIEFSAGNGCTVTYELIEDDEPATYRRAWFQKYGINPERVRRFRVSGDSMEPMLFARDTILVNTGETNVIDGKLYAIRYGDELRVKYLFRRLDGTLTLHSVNPQYKDEEVPPELAQEHITVIGRVRDKSGTGGL